MRPALQVPERAEEARDDSGRADPGQPQSRRAILAGALGGLVGAAATALGRPQAAAAAAGDPLVIGQTNFGGSSATRLNTTSSGGALWMTQYGFGSGIRADSVSGHGGVFNTEHGDRYGVNAANTAALGGTGAAVRASGANSHGIYATTSSANKNAMRGENDSSSSNGHAIYGSMTSNNAGQGSVGVGGHNSSSGSDTSGVHGSAEAGRGVYGTSTSGYGVYGASGSGVGVRGHSTSGDGVSGTTSAASGNGVKGTVQGAGATGVWGEAGGDAGHGVIGTTSANSSNAAGIYGEGAGDSYAGYFSGTVNASGAVLTPEGASIRIDHPLDPADKVLTHASVQSSELKTIYDGVVTTDSDGEAIVELPAWFEALNSKVRYQLTPLADARVWVKSRVSDGRFVIASDEPGVEICWQVTGVRHDAYARAHELTTERVKRGGERGRYFNPVEHGVPESKAIGWEARPSVRRGASGSTG